jgi:hypothetical protein
VALSTALQSAPLTQERIELLTANRVLTLEENNSYFNETWL